MFKHANTYFPGDRVTSSLEQSKQASQPDRGQVTGADPETGKLKVAWDDGRTTWQDPEDIMKE